MCRPVSLNLKIIGEVVSITALTGFYQATINRLELVKSIPNSRKGPSTWYLVKVLLTCHVGKEKIVFQDFLPNSKVTRLGNVLLGSNTWDINELLLCRDRKCVVFLSNGIVKGLFNSEEFTS